MVNRTRRVLLVVLDSVGIGEMPDAADFGDAGAATLQHTAEAMGGLRVPNLEALGLGRVAPIAGVQAVAAPLGWCGNPDGLIKTEELLADVDQGLIFVNLVDFDMLLFEHVGGVHGPLCGAGAHQGVQFIDEEDDLTLGGDDFFEHGFQAIFEFAAKLGAGHQGA